MSCSSAAIADAPNRMLGKMHPAAKNIPNSAPAPPPAASTSPRPICLRDMPAKMPSVMSPHNREDAQAVLERPARRSSTRPPAPVDAKPNAIYSTIRTAAVITAWNALAVSSLLICGPVEVRSLQPVVQARLRQRALHAPAGRLADIPHGNKRDCPALRHLNQIILVLRHGLNRPAHRLLAFSVGEDHFHLSAARKLNRALQSAQCRRR